MTTNQDAIDQSQVTWDLLRHVQTCSADLKIQGPPTTKTGWKMGGWPLTGRLTCFTTKNI